MTADPPSRRPPSAPDAVTSAWHRMLGLLFRPFEPKGWLVFAVCVFLPIRVFFRAYSAGFFSQLGGRYTLFPD